MLDSILSPPSPPAKTTLSRWDRRVQREDQCLPLSVADLLSPSWGNNVNTHWTSNWLCYRADGEPWPSSCPPSRVYLRTVQYILCILRGLNYRGLFPPSPPEGYVASSSPITVHHSGRSSDSWESLCFVFPLVCRFVLASFQRQPHRRLT